jgi:LmbE family N-acetylglucosaminyl deacetylase
MIMNRILWKAGYFIVICTVLSIFSFTGLFLYTARKTVCNVTAEKNNILIFAPHPDDGVIIAGGYAIQTLKKGGRVKVTLLTDNKIRLKEAYSAWSVIGLEQEDILRVNLGKDLHLTLEDLPRKLEILRNIIVGINPSIIFMPLYEGGHHDHDIANYLVSSAVESLSKKIVLYESPEYNYFFSIKMTPGKLLDLLSKLIPFFEYHAPPSFINPDNALYLCMTPEEVELKKQMLSQFHSQHPENLLMHFGFNDRFKVYEKHDYCMPPHDYGNVLIYKLRNSSFKVVKRLLSRPYWKFNTMFTQEKRKKLGSLLKGC